MTFNYLMPARIISGEACITREAALLATLGSRAFIMTGPSSARSNGSLSDVCTALDSQNIPWVHYDRVRPNPSVEEVRKAADLAMAENCDWVIAIGGGSPIDAAKAVAVIAGCQPSDDELFSCRSFARVLPLVAVPTTAGTGSEVTPYSILTNARIESKSNLCSPQIFPRIAFLDARYTLSLPHHVTAATACDAISHAVEGYLAVRSMPLARVLALEALSCIGKVLPDLLEMRSLSIGQRHELLYASTLAGMVIAQTGTTAPHALGYSLSYFKNIDHGIANSLVMKAYLEFIAGAREAEVARVLQALGCSSPKAFGQIIDALFDPLSLSDSETAKFAAIAIKAANIQNTNPRPTEEDLVAMLVTSQYRKEDNNDN